MQDGNPTEPGWVFRPGDTPTESAQPAPAPVTPVPTPISAPDPVVPYAQEAIAPEPASEEAFAEWTASEYIASPKNAGWFTLLAAASILVAVIVFVVTRDIISTVVTLTLGVLLGIFAARKPRTLPYRIDKQGIHIGTRLYEYTNFKSFSIDHDHAIGHISLMPLKRFMPPLSF